MITKKLSGFTLIELMFTLGVIGILLNVALPSFNEHIDKSKITAEVKRLKGILQLSRKTAITNSNMVTICPRSEAGDCGKNWSDGYITFIDKDQDRQLSTADSLLHQHTIENEKISLRWRAFGVRSSLQWHQTGITNHQNGSFEFCYKDKPEFARGLFITKAGRIRQSKDSNGDNIHENASGNNISC